MFPQIKPSHKYNQHSPSYSNLVKAIKKSEHTSVPNRFLSGLHDSIIALKSGNKENVRASSIPASPARKAEFIKSKSKTQKRNSIMITKPIGTFINTIDESE